MKSGIALYAQKHSSYLYSILLLQLLTCSVIPNDFRIITPQQATNTCFHITFERARHTNPEHFVAGKADVSTQLTERYLEGHTLACFLCYENQFLLTIYSCSGHYLTVI